MIADYPGCEKCPLNKSPCVGSRGKGKKEGILLLQDFPVRDDLIRDKPLMSAGGRLVREVTKLVGIEADQSYTTFAVMCKPEEGKMPTPKAVACCHERLMQEFSEVKPKKALLLGPVALQTMISPGKGAPITKYQGGGFTASLEYPEGGSFDLYCIPTYPPVSVIKTPDLFRDFAAAVQKFALNNRPMDPLPFDLVICRTPEDAVKELQYMRKTFTTISCDLETTGFSALEDEIMSFAFGGLDNDGAGYSVVIPAKVANPFAVRQAMVDILQDEEIMILFHNLKFDLQFLQEWFEFRLRPPKVRDTMLMVYAQDERGIGAQSGKTEEGKEGASQRGYRTVGLKDQARTRYDIPPTAYEFDFKAFFALPEEERDWDQMYEYQGTDVFLTLMLYWDVLAELEDESPKLLELVDRLLVPAALAFTEIELTGVPLDIPYMEELTLSKKAEAAEMLKKLEALGTLSGLKEELNPRSHVQVKKVLHGLGFDAPKTDKTTLSLIADDPQYVGRWSPEVTEFIHLLIGYRQAMHTISTYLEGLLKRADASGRVHPDVLIHGADTGRIAYQDPNLQNMPMLMGMLIRDAFIAPKGKILIIMDYSQLELRIAAWVSQDPNMVRVFRDGRDIHAEAAVSVFKKPADQITKAERYAAKCMNFGVLYGRGAKSLVEGIEARILATEYNQTWTLAEAERVMHGVLDGFPHFKKWILGQHAFVHKHHYIESAIGRRRRFPFIPRRYRGDVERRSQNTPIQSLASDINLDAAVTLHNLLPKGAEILFLVHDSIMVMCNDDNKQIYEVRDLMTKVMENPTLIDKGNVVLKVDAEVGWKWGKMKSWEKWEAGEVIDDR